MPEKYRKKPIIIKAIKYQPTKNGIAEILRFCPSARLLPASILIPTLEGTMQANPGDYIIKGVAGEFYPCKPGIFEQT